LTRPSPCLIASPQWRRSNLVREQDKVAATFCAAMPVAKKSPAREFDLGSGCHQKHPVACW